MTGVDWKSLPLLAFAWASYLAFARSGLYLIGFVGNLHVPRGIDDAAHLAATSTVAALAINTLLVLTFAVHHSACARASVKRRIQGVVPPVLERSLYVLVASLLLILLMWQWRAMPGLLWSVGPGPARSALWSLFGAGWVLALLSSFRLGHSETFGVRPALRRFQRRRHDNRGVERRTMYAIVRHPMYVGFLVGIWATPDMSVGHLQLAILLTLYVLVGRRWEERDLRARHGEEYRQYQQDVPAFIPHLRSRLARPVTPRNRFVRYDVQRTSSSGGGPMRISICCALLSGALSGACAVAPQPRPAAFCDLDARSAVVAMVEAHGGLDAWRALDSIYVEREHRFIGTAEPIRFDIHGEYRSHRIFQAWQAPAGTLAWDGERAWSMDWPLADRLMPRYVSAIGFYLVNMPWLVQDPSIGLETRGCSGTLPGHADRRFLVVVADYEPDPVRKPAWYEGPRDRYHLYIDPDSHRLGGVLQRWSYAGRLDAAGVAADVDAIDELFVPESFVEVQGLIWPEAYSAYAPDGAPAARGRFFGYDFSRPFDVDRLFPEGSERLKPDLSSSYFRKL